MLIGISGSKQVLSVSQMRVSLKGTFLISLAVSGEREKSLPRASRSLEPTRKRPDGVRTVAVPPSAWEMLTRVPFCRVT